MKWTKIHSAVAICKSQNGESGNGMGGMMEMRGIRVGMQEFRVGMRGIRVGMQEIKVGMREIRVGMQGIRVGMQRI